MSDSVKTLLHMAHNSYYREKKYHKAMEFLAEAINIAPDSVKAHFLKGLCELSLSQIPKAVNSFNTVIKLDPDNVDSLLNLAFINIIAGDYDQAKEFINRVLAKKNVSEAFELLADLAHKKKAYKEAIDYYDRAIQLAPTRDELYRKKALCHGEIKQFKEAIRYSELAFELNNQNYRAKELADDMTRDYFSKGRGFWAGLLLRLQMPYLKEKLKDEMLVYDEIKKIKQDNDALSVDTLMKIRNPTWFHSNFPAICDKAKSSSHSITVIFLDLDNMKIYNELFGHGVLNQVLSLIGNAFLKSTTGEDVAVRYAGDEFVMILPNSDKVRANTVLNSFLNRIDEMNKNDLPALSVNKPITFSMGMASAPQDIEVSGEDWSEQLLVKADLAALWAKRNGKKQLCIYDLKRKDEFLLVQDTAAKDAKAKAVQGERA